MWKAAFGGLFRLSTSAGNQNRTIATRSSYAARRSALEEMLGAKVPSGALFYGKTRHRLDVEFDEALRKETEKAAGQLHELIGSGITPKPVYN